MCLVDPATSSDALQAAFLAVLPTIEGLGRHAFRRLRCPHARQEALQELRALAWGWFVRLARRGKDAGRFAAALAEFAVRAVRSGRRLCGMDSAGDVLSPRARYRRGFDVGRLPEDDLLSEALRDNRRTPVPDQVCFRQDFPAWLGTRSDRDRRLIGLLMAGARAKEAAARQGLSPSRVSQLRRAFRDDWQHFTEAAPDDLQTATR